MDMIDEIINYINEKMVICDNANEGIVFLKKLSKFIEERSYRFSDSDALILIKNSMVLSGVLELIFDPSNDKKTISSLNSLALNNDIVGDILMAYAELNGINLEDFLLGKGISKSILSDAEFKELFERLYRGDMDARYILFERNIGLVKFQAHKFAKKSGSYEDFYQQGCEGLLKAIDNYDLSKNTRFSTYAVIWIRSCMYDYLNEQESDVYIPDRGILLLRKLYAIKDRLYAELNRQPSIRELADEMNLDESKIEELLKINTKAARLDAPLKDDADSDTLEAVIPDDSYIEDAIMDSIYSDESLEIIKRVLTDREFNILMLRFGIYGGREHTLDEVGQIMGGLTRERIRQIEDKVLKKLRSPKVKKMLSVSSYSIKSEGFKIDDEPVYDTAKHNSNNILGHFPGISKERILNAILHLPFEQALIIYKKYGFELNEYNSIGKQESKTLHGAIINNLKKILSGQKIAYRRQNIFASFSRWPKSAVIRAVEMLSDDDREYLFSKYGKDLNEEYQTAYAESFYLEGEIKKNIYLNLCLLKDKNNNSTFTRHINTIFMLFPLYSESEIRAAIEKLPLSWKNIINKRYGVNLDEYNEISISELSMLLLDIKDEIMKILPKKNLFELLDLPEDVVMEKVKELSDNEREDLYKRFGYDLSSRELPKLDNKFTEHVDVDIILKLKNTLSNQLRILQIGRAIADRMLAIGLSDFSREELIILAVKLKIGQRIVYSDEDAAKILGISCDEMNYVTNNIMLKYSDKLDDIMKISIENEASSSAKLVI